MELPQMSDLEARMKCFYNESAAYHDLLMNHEAFRLDLAIQQYVSLVSKHSSSHGILLDLGCGTGATTRGLAASGCHVVGLDISSLLLKRQQTPSPGQEPMFVLGDIARLPLRSRSVQCVSMHNVIEHVPDTDRLLHEVARVLREDGKVVIVSPNLLSPLKPFRHIFGVGGFNTRFYGSRWRALSATLVNFCLLVRKSLSRRPQFTYRTPLLGDEFQCPDDDAVYMANVVDLKRWFNNEGFTADYLQFLPTRGGVVGRLESKVLNTFPWLDKGFCLIAQRTPSASR